jgi:proline iminopeptidase
VQGRYDAVCPAISSYELHQAWPSAQYCIVADAGHAAFEPGIRSELVKATEAMHLRLRPV